MVRNKFVEALVGIITEFPKMILVAFDRDSFFHKNLRMIGIDPKTAYFGFKNLERRKLLTSKNGKLNFTPKGKTWIQICRYKNLKIHNDKWDRKWRIIIFDIPESLKNQRKQLRRKLKLLGFFNLQKSVLVCPFSCEAEINFLADYLKIKPHLNIIMADCIGEREKEVKMFFGL